MGKRIGLFGGTFNPVHAGHIVVAKSIDEQLDLDELRFIPAAQSPFKDKPNIDDHHRLAMLELAIKSVEGFTVDSRELAKPPPSFTIDTLKSIAREQTDDQLCLLIGIDAWLDFEQWHDWQSIADLCCLVVMTRPGYAQTELSGYWQSKKISSTQDLANGKLIFMAVLASNASSSMIRRQIRDGAETKEYLDSAVAQYIDAHQLYR